PEALPARPIATDDARFDELRRAHGGVVDITSYTRMKSAVGGYRAPDEPEEREVALLELVGGLAVLARRVAEMPFLHPIPERDHPRLDQAPPSPDRPAITIERGYVRGVIDLVFEHEGRYHVLDWKSDRLPSYALEPLAKHVERNYAVQAKLYSLGALRALAIHDREAYDRRFGGLVYCFVRGMREGAGVWTSRPAWDDVLAWERALRDEQAPWGYALPPRRGRGR
ncbi:MAG: PD-(D/E)XK nuclease family protein, partial [Sandaracinaceae bacterium]|nr:PD-(D/E)XK nuclease family protein [Sandaracinaceae bacterium]